MPTRGGSSVSVERYLERCRLKTAVLFRAACELGALERRQADGALGAFGEQIGLAFQILDDVLDVSGPPERTGKPRGTDLLDGTVTLPLIVARERDPGWRRSTFATVRTAHEAAAVCDRIAATGALEGAKDRALELVADAKAVAAGLPAASALRARAGRRRRRRALHLDAARRRARSGCLRSLRGGSGRPGARR